MKLYHFTTRIHLASIKKAGALTLTESNIGSPRPEWPPHGDHVGPDVVWLTNNPTPHALRTGLSTGDPIRHGDRLIRTVDKREIRFTVELPADDAHEWLTWARTHGIHPEWLAAMTSNYDAAEWYVCERPIKRAEWTEVLDLTQFRGVGRNAPCPCGSGRKFKQCHGGPRDGRAMERGA